MISALKWFYNRVGRVSLAAGVIILCLSTRCLARDTTAPGPAIIFLTADWCGTCRELSPVVDRAVKSAKNHFDQVTLDVDKPNAPEQASKYGISLNGSDLPQVYLYQKGKTRLLYNGRQYHFGHTRQVEESIRNEINANEP